MVSHFLFYLPPSYHPMRIFTRIHEKSPLPVAVPMGTAPWACRTPLARCLSEGVWGLRRLGLLRAGSFRMLPPTGSMCPHVLCLECSGEDPGLHRSLS